MTTTVLRHDDSGSVLVSNGEFQAWIDVDVVDKDVRVEWNKYIFHLPWDRFQRDEQDKIENFEAFTDTAVSYLSHIGYLNQDDKGSWSINEEAINNKPEHLIVVIDSEKDVIAAYPFFMYCDDEPIIATEAVLNHRGHNLSNCQWLIQNKNQIKFVGLQLVDK
jgi:hypothetical protein